MTSIPQYGLSTILAQAPVVPVVTVVDVHDAVPLAKALVAGGLSVIEVTLRTAAALDAIYAIAAEVEGAIVGAGTVREPAQLAAAARAGARFAVSPGFTARLLDAAADTDPPLLPGVATASEAMTLIDRGYRFAKFFPAEPAGGRAYLSALAGPLPQLMFCPTGGITIETAPRYLDLPNVVCIGGSWMVTHDRIAAKDWTSVEGASRTAATLRQPPRRT
ncbi:keto-deoxy-phosphogluconate aldolase [Bradyrhizobium sp. LTSP885]|uniref:bifunctional 4-hydroxy-2-oxoglutarate aldolase/2-dehydro-3-deoxy-phosphogluconate aldolase n=1 Tax=Bradyrhizobium sp. LTSP885 TaxID=1619232 RepID=UPI0005CAFDEE|nr:bifunctional 4-hydroxy-2-oxoglutarate aldolase/2-dehydro-3-deoxy-phosphogluconate aldolase [Bradyrhizobium sp. LTSP885]KJC50487.1 keto-deoxy-phosphogluconate aldolase [Bradyrhizobium sp. LTSP885]